MEINDIYYLSDQFGPKFIRIESIDEWVKFYKCPSLIHIIRNHKTFFSSQRTHTTSHNLSGPVYMCEKSQIKRWNLDKLINESKFNEKYNRFIGCIKIEKDIINNILNNIYDINHICVDKTEDDLICRKLTQSDFRNLQINKLFS